MSELDPPVSQELALFASNFNKSTVTKLYSLGNTKSTHLSYALGVD